MMQEQNDQLCRLAQQGDLQAASELLKLHYGKIYAYFWRLTSSEAEAGDLTQKTFCKVWNSIGTYKRNARFSTWLYSIAHHVYVDWRRVAQRTATQTEDWWLNCPADGPSPFEDAAEKEMAHQLYALVEKLEEPTRETVHLHYYQGLTLQETADALGVATSTVKYRLRSALDLLRARIPETKF